MSQAPRSELVTVYATVPEAAAWRSAADAAGVGKLGSWVRRVGVDAALAEPATRYNRVPRIVEPSAPIWWDALRWGGEWNGVVKHLNQTGRIDDARIRWIMRQAMEVARDIHPRLEPGPLPKLAVMGPVKKQIQVHLYPGELAKIREAAEQDRWGKSSAWLRAQASGAVGLAVVPRGRRIPLPAGWKVRRRALAGVVTNIGQVLDGADLATDQRSLLEDARGRIGAALGRMTEVEVGAVAR